MVHVMIRCPKTGSDVNTGVQLVRRDDADVLSLDDLEIHETIMNCPACGEQHVWGRSEAFLAGEPAAI